MWRSRCLELLVLVVAFLCRQGATSRHLVNGHVPCPEMNGEPAQCKRIEECPAVKTASFKRCRYSVYQEFVCCSAISRSEQMCRALRRRRPTGITLFSQRILAGNAVMDGKYTHMVAIGYMQNMQIHWGCGGALISSRYVLTAAHCVENRMRERASVARLGRSNLTSPSTPGVDYPIADFQAFPDYSKNEVYNDIALAKLGREVTFSATVYPACLHTGRTGPGGLTATGWGATLPEGIMSSTRLLEVNLTVVPLEECKAHYTSIRDPMLPKGVTEDMLCARDPLGKGDTCEGDSGGPLQVLEDTTSPVYSVVAITNFGPKPCGGRTPSVYSRVSSYLDWIEGIVWP